MSQYSPLQPGDPTHLGRYEVIGRLGQGGMGVVFLGRDDLGPVAIKTIKSMNVGDERAMRLFRREVDAARRVPRRCTAQLFEYDLDHVPPFIVSEYIKGPTLDAEVQAHGPLPASRLHGVAIGVAAALSEIHHTSIVHGDLTPRNVLITPEGRPRVIDFGIARVPEQTTSSGKHIVGTLAYMSPEHLSHGQISTAADVFAWGSVMAFAGTGRPPFGQGSNPQVVHRILHERPDLTGLDSTIEPFVEAALQKDPDRRPTAAWLQRELKKAAQTAADQLRIAEVTKVLQSAQLGSDRPIPMVEEAVPAERRDGFPRRLTGSLLLLAAVVLILGAWLDSLGGLGTAARGLAQWLFGYGTYVLPLLVGWWAVAVLLGPSTAALWPEGWEALWERSARSVGRAAWSAIRTITHSPTLGGMVAVSLGGLGLLHLSRGMPPANASFFELSQSGGLLGALLVGILNPLLSPWIARIFLVVALLLGAIAVAWPIRGRFGTWPAAAALIFCVGLATGPALYLKRQPLSVLDQV
jgi:predicted Ser/Thr protein kinase